MSQSRPTYPAARDYTLRAEALGWALLPIRANCEDRAWQKVYDLPTGGRRLSVEGDGRWIAEVVRPVWEDYRDSLAVFLGGRPAND